MIEDHAARCGVPVRFAATKLVEGDEPTLKQLQLTDNECDIIDHIVREMEHDLKTDREAALADMRYAYIEKLCKDTVVKPKQTKEQGALHPHRRRAHAQGLGIAHLFGHHVVRVLAHLWRGRFHGERPIFPGHRCRDRVGGYGVDHSGRQ